MPTKLREHFEHLTRGRPPFALESLKLSQLDLALLRPKHRFKSVQGRQIFSAHYEWSLERFDIQKLSFNPNCRLRGGNVPPACPNCGLFRLLLPTGPVWPPS